MSDDAIYTPCGGAQCRAGAPDVRTVHVLVRQDSGVWQPAEQAFCSDCRAVIRRCADEGIDSPTKPDPDYPDDLTQ